MAANERADTFHEQANTYQHLRDYIDSLILGGGELPEFHARPKRHMAQLHRFNMIYPVRKPCYVHVRKPPGGKKMYVPIEPVMGQKAMHKYNEVLDSMMDDPYNAAPAATCEQKQDALRRRSREMDAQKRGGPLSGLLRALHLGQRPRLSIWVQIDKEDRPVIGYHIVRDLMGHGALEPIVRDPLSTRCGRRARAGSG